MAKNRSKIGLSIFILGVFMSALDNGIISSALSTIDYSFKVSEVTGTWSVTLYTLGMAISTPIVGKMADKYGRKKLFLIEIAIFAIGSLLVSLSPTFSMLLVSRLLQSIGGGGIFIIASSHILSTYPKKQQGALLGALGAVNGIASVVGPNIGALILNMTNKWNYLFLINLPIAVIVLVVGYFTIPETRDETVKLLDYKGLIYFTLGILSIMFSITNLKSGAIFNSMLSPAFWLPLLIGLIVFTIFVHAEANIPDKIDPFIPYNLLKKLTFLTTLFVGLLSGMLIAIFVFIPAFVEQRFGISANDSGIWMSGIGLGSILGAGLGGGLVNKLGSPKTVIVSGLISALGFLGIAAFSNSTVLFLTWSAIAGLGFGMLMGAPLSIIVSEISDKKDNGVALGTLSVTRQVGLTLAPTIYATILQQGFHKMINFNKYSSVESFYRNISASDHQALNAFRSLAATAYGKIFFFATACSIIILFCGWYLKRKEATFASK